MKVNIIPRYQQSEQSPSPQIIKHKKRTTTYGNPVPDCEQAQICGGIKPLMWSWSFNNWISNANTDIRKQQEKVAYILFTWETGDFAFFLTIAISDFLNINSNPKHIIFLTFIELSLGYFLPCLVNKLNVCSAIHVYLGCFRQ